MMASTSTASSQPISTSAVSGTKIGIANALRKGALKDLGMPFVKKVTPRAVVEGFKGEEKEEEEIVDNNVMTFTLLSKKGSKQQVRSDPTRSDPSDADTFADDGATDPRRQPSGAQLDHAASGGQGRAAGDEASRARLRGARASDGEEGYVDP